MRITLLFLAIVFSTGCMAEPTPQERANQSKAVQSGFTPYTGDLMRSIEIVEIEGCEYIKQPVTHGYTIYSHKGNCKNRIHSLQSEKTEALRSYQQEKEEEIQRLQEKIEELRRK